jgi:flagellar protein FliO/FliZ
MGTSQYVFAITVLVFVVALIALAGLLLRRFAPGGMMRWRPGLTRRLGVVEVAALDPKRRLVLVRRDEVEHLLLLGGGTDLVIESGIRPVFRAHLAEADHHADAIRPSSERKEPTL